MSLELLSSFIFSTQFVCLDPGGVDWVASHPFLEQSTQKNIILEQTNGNTWEAKTL